MGYFFVFLIFLKCKNKNVKNIVLFSQKLLTFFAKNSTICMFGENFNNNQ